MARAKERGMSAVEAALGFAILASVAAVAVPAFFRDLRSSHFAEATEGLAVIGEGAVAYATPLPIDRAFPPSAPVTPPRPPRGTREVDPPAIWQTPTWIALHFPPPHGSGRAFSEGEAHRFAFSFDSTLARTRSSFVARAHGDLDGNGTLSTFEIRGHAAEGEPQGPIVEPGTVVLDPLE